MTTLREAAQQALEALENHTAIKHPQQRHYRDEAIEALRAALAEPVQKPVQKPVAWQWLDTAHLRKKIPAHSTPSEWRPLYTAPPQRKPLSEREVGAIMEELNAYGTRLYEFARAIEKAHGIE